MHHAPGMGEHPRQHRHQRKITATRRDGACPVSLNLSLALNEDPRFTCLKLPRRYTCKHASHAALSLECHSRPQNHSLAQSVPLVAHGDVHRHQDDANRLRGILGIYVDGARQPMALFKMDGRNGSLHSSQN